MDSRPKRGNKKIEAAFSNFADVIRTGFKQLMSLKT